MRVLWNRNIRVTLWRALIVAILVLMYAQSPQVNWAVVTGGTALFTALLALWYEHGTRCPDIDDAYIAAAAALQSCGYVALALAMYGAAIPFVVVALGLIAFRIHEVRKAGLSWAKPYGFWQLFIPAVPDIGVPLGWMLLKCRHYVCRHAQ